MRRLMVQLGTDWKEVPEDESGVVRIVSHKSGLFFRIAPDVGPLRKEQIDALVQPLQQAVQRGVTGEIVPVFNQVVQVTCQLQDHAGKPV